MDQLRKAIVSVGLLLALVPACDGGTTPPPADIELTPDVVSATHTVGSSPCPQEVGVITIRNGGTEELTATRVGSDSDFDVLDADGTSLGETGSVTVPAGGSTTVTVIFLCNQEPPLSSLVDFSFRRGGADAGYDSVEVTLSRGP